MTVIAFPTAQPVLYLVEGQLMIARGWPVEALHEAAGRAGLGRERFVTDDDPPYYRVERDEVPGLVERLPLHGYGGGMTALIEAMQACKRSRAPNWLKGFEWLDREDRVFGEIERLAMTRTRPFPRDQIYGGYTCTTPRTDSWAERLAAIIGPPPDPFVQVETRIDGQHDWNQCGKSHHSLPDGDDNG